MNIIELLEIQRYNNTTSSQLNDLDVVNVLHQLEVDVITHPFVDKDLSSLLTNALTNYKEELQFLINNCTLYNFFAKKEVSSSNFPSENLAVSNERIKSFISNFLNGELELFFDQNLATNNFEKVNSLLVARGFFPNNVLDSLFQTACQKIDFVTANLSVVNSDLSQILYIKRVSFYEFLSFFRKIEIDEKLKLLLKQVVAIYSINNSSDFATTTITSMYNYNPVEVDFLETLKRQRNLVYESKSSSGGPTSKFSWKILAIVLVVLVRIVFLGVRWASNNSRSHYDNFENTVPDTITEEPPQLDPYYANMQHKIDSFQVFLAGYNKADVKYVKYNNTIKTGDNPFENVYKNASLPSNGSPIQFKNRTKYDLILLENPLAFDSIKMPGRAYFIKSGTIYKLDDVPLHFHRVFNFYIGKKLASFVTNSHNVFVKNNSVMEPRFSELLPESTTILKQDYTFNANVVIKEDKGKIQIISE